MCTAGPPSKSPMTVHFYRGAADQNWFSVVVFEKSSGCTPNLPLLSFYLYTAFKTGIAAACEPIPLE